MRTRSILLAAAVFAAGVGASLAQAPAFSANAVGHVSKTLTNQYNLLSNPLNGTNNQLNTILPIAPEDSYILRWDPVGQTFGDPSFYIGGAWDPNVTINPGEGFFLYSAAPGTSNITFVGEVAQGPSTVVLHTGYNLISHVPPVIVDLVGPSVNFPANEDDYVLFWLAAGQTYGDPIFYIGGAWTSPVVVPIAEAFFYNTTVASPLPWNRTFSVN